MDAIGKELELNRVKDEVSRSVVTEFGGVYVRTWKPGSMSLSLSQSSFGWSNSVRTIGRSSCSEGWQVEKNFLKKHVDITDFFSTNTMMTPPLGCVIIVLIENRQQLQLWRISRLKRHRGDKGGVDGIYLAFDYTFLNDFYLHTSWHPPPPSPH